MPLWEYKVISSGKGGFATPALMESFLNQLGKDEWEIIHFQTPSDNALAFQGLARRSTQRDWTLEDAAAAAARVEAEKLRAEFEAKFRGAGAGGAAAEDKPESLAEQRADADGGLRRLRDTDSDQDPDTDEKEAAPEAEADDWDKLAKEEELPTFFEAIQPLMRRNQRGAGMSVGVDHLAKKWGMSEDDVRGALRECGFGIPDDEDDRPEYLEYDGDLFWVNVNRRGEYWVNTKEKPRALFKTVKAPRFAPEPKEGAEAGAPPGGAHAEGAAQSPGGAHGEGASPDAALAREGEAGPYGESAPAESSRGDEREGRDRRGNDRGQDRGDARRRGLPEGMALLERIKPHMRRNRSGAGGSGSVGFLSRALKCRENELVQAFAALGLVLAGEEAGTPPAELAIGERIWWLNKDSRGGIWINERRKTDEAPSGAAPGFAPADASGAPMGSPSGEAASAGTARGVATEVSLSSEAPAMPPPEQVAADAVERATVATETVPDLGTEDDEEDAEPGVAAGMAAPLDGASLPPLLQQLRPLLKETRSGAFSGEIGALAAAIGQDREQVLAELAGLGLKAPEKAREKSAPVDFGGQSAVLSRTAKDELILSVKSAGAPKRPRRSRRGPIEAGE